MRKIYISLFLVFIFCAQNEVVEETINPESTIIEPKATNEESSTTSTTLEIVQLESFENVEFIVLKEKSVVGYLAPKQFLNSGLDIVEGTTREIIGGFTLTLSECDQADSCLYLKDLQIKADISTLKSNNIIRDQAINNQWLQSTLFPEAIFTIDELVLPNKDFNSKVEDTIVGKLTIEGDILPTGANQNLGSPENRWQNVYTMDLHLANDRGNWTVIEEENYLTLRNNKNGKRYKLVMEELPEDGD